MTNMHNQITRQHTSTHHQLYQYDTSNGHSVVVAPFQTPWPEQKFPFRKFQLHSFLYNIHKYFRMQCTFLSFCPSRQLHLRHIRSHSLAFKHFCVAVFADGPIALAGKHSMRSMCIVCATVCCRHQWQCLLLLLLLLYEQRRRQHARPLAACLSSLRHPCVYTIPSIQCAIRTISMRPLRSHEPQHTVAD